MDSDSHFDCFLQLAVSRSTNATVDQHVTRLTMANINSHTIALIVSPLSLPYQAAKPNSLPAAMFHRSLLPLTRKVGHYLFLEGFDPLFLESQIMAGIGEIEALVA